MTAHHLVAGDGEPTVLLLHGLGGDAHYWGPVLETLGARRRTVAWTMPGYGDSPPVDPMTFPALADAATEVLDAVGAASAVVIGHSMGGMVAQQMWADHPDRVAGLVLVGTSPSFGGGNAEFIDSFLEARLAPITAGRTPADIAPGLIDELTAATPAPEARARAVDAMSAISAAGYEAAVRCLTTFDRRDTLGSINVPTLLVSGSRDRLGPTRLMASMAAEIPGATHTDIDGSGHLVDIEAPAEFLAAVSSFLDEHWPVAAA